MKIRIDGCRIIHNDEQIGKITARVCGRVYDVSASHIHNGRVHHVGRTRVQIPSLISSMREGLKTLAKERTWSQRGVHPNNRSREEWVKFENEILENG